jgi:predicted outer membrane repeat protein
MTLLGASSVQATTSPDALHVDAHVSIRSEGRGQPYFNFRDGREMTVEYRGERALTDAFQSELARPLSLASADLDRNGTPDLIAGYALGASGIITIQRGNPDAYAPADDSVFVRLQQGYDPESLLPETEVLALPVAPDFLFSGHFTGRSETDLLFAAKGGDLYVMPGNARGGFGQPRQIGLPGDVTALAVGEFGAPDGLTDFAVGVAGKNGNALLIFDGKTDFSSPVMRYSMTAPASAIEFGGLDDDPFLDIAAASGNDILVVHGWTGKQAVDARSRLERVELPRPAQGLTIGEFVWDRQGHSEIAVLTDDDVVRVLQSAGSDTHPFSETESAQRTRERATTGGSLVANIESVAGWQPTKAAGWTPARQYVASSAAMRRGAVKPLLRTNLSGRALDDLTILEEIHPSIELLHSDAADDSTSTARISAVVARSILDVDGAPVALLTLPRKINGVVDTIVLSSSSTRLKIVPNAPNTTITVDRTDDPSGAGLTAASACTAAPNDCSLRGAFQFSNLPSNNNTTISLPANTYILSINGTNAGGCDGNTVGDLGANQTVSLVGAGAATTIIRQTATGPANDGDRIMCMNEPFTVGLIYNFSGVTFVGGREGSAAGTGAVLGGAGIIGGELNNSLTMTNVVMANNQETVIGSANLGGGALQITGGNLIITNCTIGGSAAPGAYTDRTSTNTANSQMGSGGGIAFTPSSPQHSGGTGTLTVTGSTFSRNTASGIGGGGADLLIFAFASPGGIGSGSASIGTSTFSNNQASNGGGIIVESLPTTVATSSFNNNSATNRGGGIYVGGASLQLDGTTPSITFTGNTATNGGSSVSTASAVTVAGTNTTIGGDIEISTLGSWTNNAGSTLAPTNVVVTGGTFNMNNSSMNVSGNLTVGPGPVVGSTFNGHTGTVNIQGNFVLNAGGSPATTLNAGTGTFNFNGTGAQSITNGTSITFFNLTDSNVTQPLTLNNSLAVNGTLNVNGANAVLSPVAGAVISGTGTLTGTGTARASRIAATADFLTQYTITNKTLTNLTVNYSGAGNQTVNNTPAYSNLVISGSGTKTLQGNTSITRDLNITAGTFAGSTFNFSLGGNWTNGATFNPGTGTVTFAGTTGTQLLTGNTTFFNLTLNNPGATTNFGTTTTTVGNDLVASAGTMDGGTSTIIFTGVTDNLGAISGVSPKNFHTLQINSPATISHSAGADITIENDYSNAGVFNQAPALMTTFASDNNGDGNHLLSGAGTSTFGNVVISGANAVDAGTHNFTVVGGSFTSTGSFTGANTVTFSGATPQTIAGDGAKSFNNLTVNNGNGVTLANGAGAIDASVGGLLTLSTDLTAAPGSILQQSGTSAGSGDVIGTVRRTDLGVATRSFGNVDNAITISSGTAPSQLDFNLVKAPPATFPAAFKVVPRDITLTPTGGSGMSATVTLRYIDPTELTPTSITESSLALWKNIAGTWTPQGGTVEAANNRVTLNGVTSFSEWAIGEAADLTLSKANDVSNAAVTGQTWKWTLTATDTGAPVTFTAGQTILVDNLPNSNITYGSPTPKNFSNITGSANINCSIVSNDLTCIANGGNVTFATNLGASHFDVELTATAQTVASYANPRGGGLAKVDPNNAILESIETNNDAAANTVAVSKANTTTTITSDNPDPSVVGQQVTVQWTVTVNAPGSIGAALSGNVTVTDGSANCTALVSAGQCTITFTSAGPKNLTATYAGDTNYNGSSSTPATAHTVNKADTSTTITSDSPDPSSPTTSVVVQYSVVVTGAGAGTPTGNVVVSDGTDSCSGTVAAGQCTVTLTTPGTRNLVATYAGDSDFNGSASVAQSHLVLKGSATTITADTPDPSTTGNSVSVDVTVADSSGLGGTPTGSVTVLSSSGETCTINTLVAGAGNCSITFLSRGAKTLTATYSGDSAFSSSNDTETHQVQDTTTTAITSQTPNPSVTGQGFAVTYTVTPANGGTPTGNVTVSDGTSFCTATVAAGQCTITIGAAGTATLTATYEGDVDFLTSTSTSVNQTVNKALTTTAITNQSVNPSVVGESVTITYLVGVTAPGSGTPTGNVTVSDGLGATCTASVAAGQCVITFTTSGPRTLTATYLGDSNYETSTSSGASHTVNAASTSTSITSNLPNGSVTGQPVVVTYSVAVTGGGAGTPTGNVTVTDGAGDSCSASVAAGQCTITPLSAGTLTLVATYAGDANFGTSASAGTSQTVAKANTTATLLTHTPDPSFVGQSVAVTYSIAVSAPGSGTPTGNVIVSDGVDFCTGTVAQGGCNITLTTAGSRSLTATYQGDANYNASLASPPVGHTVIDCSGVTATITPTPSQVCASSPGNTASGPAGMTSYSWQITNGIITAGANSQTVTYTAGASGTVGLSLDVVSPAGCNASDSTAVTINPIPSTPAPGNTGPYCEGATISLSVPTVSGATYTWTGPNGFTSALQNPTRTNATIADSGSYSVVVTVNGCSSPAGSTSVTISAIPSTPTINAGGPTTFCSGGSVTLTSSSASGNQWYLDGNPLGGATGSSINATASGNYTVVVTTNGCSSAASAATTVTVNPGPPTPTINAGGPTTFCSGGSVTLTSSSATGNQWFLDGSPIGGATGNSISASASGNYTVVVTSGGCSSAPSAPTSVTVNPIPTSPAPTNGGPYCEGATIALSVPAVTGATYAWTGPNGFTSSQQNPTRSSATLADSGTYSVTITVNGCTSPAGATNVVVNAIPATPTINAGGPTTFCGGGSVTLTSSSATGNQWYLDGSPIGGATGNSISATASGSYTVVVTANGCSSAASTGTSVTVNPTPTTPAPSNNGPYCEGTTIALSVPAVAGATYSWTGPNGFTSSLQNPTRANATVADSGAYSLTVTVNGCTSPAGSTNVVVNAIPASPTINAGGPTTFCSGGSVTLTSSSATGNQWYVDGNPIGGATGNSISATASGSYTVVVTANGCSSAASAATAVTVTPAPATPTINASGPTAFCSGGSVTLTSSSATGNQWYLNGAPLSGATAQQLLASVAGDYSVVVTAGGCPSASSAATTVTINPNPNATIAAPATVGTGSTGNSASVANAGAGATYSWVITGGTITSGAGTTTIAFTAGGVGTLTLQATVTAATGCSDTKSVNVNVSATPPSVTVTSVSPAVGVANGGDSVTISGSGFASGATVTFGGAAATNVVVVNATTITANTPAHAAGAVDVTVNVASNSATLSNGFTYVNVRFDANGDGVIDPADIFYLVNYLFTGGPAPRGAAGLLSGDANGDNVVDPADIFYVVNYLFTGGPAPMKAPAPRGASSVAREKLAGSVSLGKATLRNGRTVVPVMVTLVPQSIEPQAFAFRVLARGDVQPETMSIHRAGAADELHPSFEVARQYGGTASYLVVFDASHTLRLGAARSAVVAEIEISGAAEGVELEFDQSATTLSDRSGTLVATVKNGSLSLRGTTLHLRPHQEPLSPRE